MKRARFAPAAVVELEDAARRVDRARPGWGDKLNDEVLEAIERIEEYVEGWQIFDERGPERRFVLDRFPCIVVYVVTNTEIQITASQATGASGGRPPSASLGPSSSRRCATRG